MEFSVEADVFARFPGMRAETVLDEITAGLGRNFGASARRFVVDAATPRIGW